MANILKSFRLAHHNLANQTLTEVAKSTPKHELLRHKLDIFNVMLLNIAHIIIQKSSIFTQIRH